MSNLLVEVPRRWLRPKAAGIRNVPEGAAPERPAASPPPDPGTLFAILAAADSQRIHAIFASDPAGEGAERLAIVGALTGRRRQWT